MNKKLDNLNLKSHLYLVAGIHALLIHPQLIYK